MNEYTIYERGTLDSGIWSVRLWPAFGLSLLVHWGGMTFSGAFILGPLQFGYVRYKKEFRCPHCITQPAYDKPPHIEISPHENDSCLS